MQANVLEWLEGTAARLPDRTALWDETEQMTYREYREGSVKIAGTEQVPYSGIYREEREGAGVLHGDCLQRQLLFAH